MFSGPFLVYGNHVTFLWRYVCFVLLCFRLFAFVEPAALRPTALRYSIMQICLWYLPYRTYCTKCICPLHTNTRCGKGEAHIDWSMVMPKKVAPVTETIISWGLLALCRRTLGIERHPGQTRWRLAVLINGQRQGKRNKSVSMLRIQLDCGRTERTNPSRETRFSGANGNREILIVSAQLTTGRIGNFPRLIHTLLNVMAIHIHYMHAPRQPHAVS